MAIVSGGLDDADLEQFLGYNLGVAITGSEALGLTVIVTEGFGDIAMARRTHTLLTAHEGDDVSVNGTTQIRAGVIRPEIVMPLAAGMSGVGYPRFLAHEIPGLARFRGNYLYNHWGQAAVFRQIPAKILSFDELKLPEALKKLCHLNEGLVVVTGCASFVSGSGYVLRGMKWYAASGPEA